MQNAEIRLPEAVIPICARILKFDMAAEAPGVHHDDEAQEAMLKFWRTE